MINRCKSCDSIYWIATKGEPCPSCGYTIKNRFSVRKMAAVLFLWAACLALGVAVFKAVDLILG